MRVTKTYIKEHAKSYSHCAKLRLDGNVLQIINTGTGCIHPFVGREEKILLSKIDVKNVTEWLKEIYR
jgi:hypothetical protein